MPNVLQRACCLSIPVKQHGFKRHLAHHSLVIRLIAVSAAMPVIDRRYSGHRLNNTAAAAPQSIDGTRPLINGPLIIPVSMANEAPLAQDKQSRVKIAKNVSDMAHAGLCSIQVFRNDQTLTEVTIQVAELCFNASPEFS